MKILVWIMATFIVALSVVCVIEMKKIDVMTDEIDDLKSNVSTVQNDILTHRNYIKGLESDISELQSKIGGRY